MSRQEIPLREITTEEVWAEVQRLRNELLTHNHLTSGVQQLTGQVSGILESPNFLSGSTGWQILPDGSVEFNDGTFRGVLEASSIHIPDQSTANSFHTDSDGNSWWGATAIGSAVAKVLKDGAATFSSITITGGTVNWSTVSGTANAPEDNSTVGATAGTNLKDSGATTLEDDDVKNVYDFTAGENISAGKVVCFKKDQFDTPQDKSVITKDSYIVASAGDTNYGTATEFSCGVGDPGTGETQFRIYYGFVFGINDRPDKVLFRIWGNVQLAGTFEVYRVTADWAEDTITHNNQPATTTVYETGCPATVVSSTGWQWVEFDITNIIRGQMSTFWDEERGIMIFPSGGVGYMTNIRSMEYLTQTNQRPLVRRIKGIQMEDNGALFVASKLDINTSGAVGIAKETATTGNPIKVQFSGTITGLTGLTAGQDYYLGNAGAISSASAFGFNLDTPKTKIGTALSTTVLQLDIENERFLWASEPIRMLGNVTNYVFPPLDANECIIKIDSDDDSSNYSPKESVVLRRNGPTVLAVQLSPGVAGAAGWVVTYTWDDTHNKITIVISGGEASPDYVESTFYFYK